MELMFVGHLAVGLTGKGIEPRISLGAWMLAALRVRAVDARESSLRTQAGTFDGDAADCGAVKVD